MWACGHADFATGEGFADGQRHALGKTMVGGERFVVEIENVVHFPTGNHEGVSLRHRVDVEKGVEILVCRTFVGGNFSGGNFAENGHGVSVLS